MEDYTKTAFHALTPTESIRLLQSKRLGLTKEEAQHRLQEYGKNELPTAKAKSWIVILFSQFTNPLIFILVLAVLVSLFLREWVDLAIIAGAIVINTVLGFVEELRADRSLLALQSYLPEEVRVKRDGKILVIFAQDVVPGDVLLLSSGDKITADGRILELQSFEVNEAALTGESAPVKKDLAQTPNAETPGDRLCMVFAGTVVVAGTAEVIVTATGKSTEFGRINELISTLEEDQTPLQIQLARLARTIGLFVILLSVFIVAVGLWQGLKITEIFYTSVAIAVAVVPEGLVVAVTMILALGMQRMLKKKALVRKLIAAETLGSISVICLDKTGTLTTGQMAVVELRKDGTAYPLDGMGKEEEELRLALLATNSATVEIDHKTGKETVHGSPTEIALRKYALSFKKPTAFAALQQVADLPFSHVLKFSARSFKGKSGTVIYVVGAPDILLDRADITDAKRIELHKTYEEMTLRGLRVLAIASTQNAQDHEELEESLVQDLTILGFVGLKDPLREEARELIKSTQKAGIHTVMITGDHPETARHIALEAGFDVEKGGVVTGAEMDEWSDEELENRVPSIYVFARVAPIHKMRIIQAWQAHGATVAMTGDGVNDAPAIKAADIGIALGDGTSVAKESADMVLLDNNFKTIIDAVKEGRTMFDNIRKIIVYLMADSFTAAVLVLGALIAGLPMPLLPAQILLINLVVDGFPYIALAFEKSEADIMQKPPRAKSEPILNQEMKVLIFAIGLLADAILFGMYMVLLNQGLPLPEIRSFLYIALGIHTLFYIFAIRKLRTSIFTSNPFENRYLVVGVLIGFVILVLPLFVPYFRDALEMSPLSLEEWGIILVFAFVHVLLIELVKLLYNKQAKNLRIA